MKKLIIPLSIVLIILAVVGIQAVLLKKSFNTPIEYYNELYDYEWEGLEFYSAKEHKYLAKDPDNGFCNVYNMKGISENEMLYLNGFITVYASTYLDDNVAIIMNTEFEEPVKRFPVKKIIITKPNGSEMKIKDKNILKQIEEVLQNSAGSVHEYEYERVYDYNTSVYFDVDCDMSWLCIIEERTDGSIYLIGFDEKTNEFVEYDVTDILESVWK